MKFTVTALLLGSLVLFGSGCEPGDAPPGEQQEFRGAGTQEQFPQNQMVPPSQHTPDGQSDQDFNGDL